MSGAFIETYVISEIVKIFYNNGVDNVSPKWCYVFAIGNTIP